MKDTILTMNGLVQYFKKNNITSFSSNQDKKSIKVRMELDDNMIFASENEVFDDTRGLKFYDIYVCHIDKNVNGSSISKKVMKKRMNSIKNRPLLAYIHTLNDGTEDFNRHNMTIDEDGNVVYEEKQVGSFTEDEPKLVYDEERDKTYVVAKVAVPENYTSTVDIIERKGTTKVSCEIEVFECEYNVKNDYLDITDFIFTGCTCLGSDKDGTEIQEGMKGSRIELNSKNNYDLDNIRIKTEQSGLSLSTISSNYNNYNNIDMINNKLDDILICLNAQKEGGEQKVIDSLLEKYSKTLEDITFEIENLSDEELEAKFEEMFGEDEVSEIEETDVEEEELFTKQFSLSHDDIRVGLYQLLEPYEAEDNEWYYISQVYDDYFVYTNYCGVYYGQKYTKDDESVKYDGERYKLYSELLTEAEYLELKTMRENYSSLVEFKENIETAKLNEQKKEIIENEKYSVIFETEEYKSLVEELEKYSLEELETKIKVMYADCVSNTATFEMVKENKRSVSSMNFAGSAPARKDRYGGLFSK